MWHIFEDERWKRYKEISAVRGLLLWVGGSGIVMSLLSALATFFWTLYFTLPGPVRFVLSVGVFAAIGIIFAIIRWLVDLFFPAKQSSTDSLLYQPDAKNKFAISEPPRRRIAPRIVAGAVVILMFVAAVYSKAIDRLVVRLNPPPEHATALFMECDLAGLPIKMRALEMVPIISVNKMELKNKNSAGWGFFYVGPGPSDRDGAWPPNELLKQSAKLHDYGIFGYRCTVSNHGPVNLIYTSVPLDISFGSTKKGEPPFRYTAVISALDAGKDFVFYVFNDCNDIAVLIWQDTALVQVFGEAAQRNVPLHRTYKSPIDQVMMLMPTKVRWTRRYPTCE